MLLSTRSTSYEPFSSVYIDDLKPPKLGVVIFFAIFGCDAHFESELPEIDIDQTICEQILLSLSRVS